MKTINFAILAYRPEDTEDNGWRRLAITIDGEDVGIKEINYDAWNNLPDDQKDEMRFDLISGELERDLLNGNACFNDPSLYKKWYEYEFFIDGEDAREFIERVPRTRHSIRIQPRCAVEYGWKFYKVLVAHNFNKQIAADLAYWRGYLAGMDLNSPWDAEGTEAIRCMNLDLEKGKKYASDF